MRVIHDHCDSSLVLVVQLLDIDVRKPLELFGSIFNMDFLLSTVLPCNNHILLSPPNTWICIRSSIRTSLNDEKCLVIEGTSTHRWNLVQLFCTKFELFWRILLINIYLLTVGVYA